VQRIRRDLGLGIKGPARRPKVPVRPEAKVKATAVNDVWCIDVVFDTTQGGNTVKFLTIIDEYSHYCLDIVASRRLGAREVVAALASLIELHGAPGHLRCDNGAEFIAGSCRNGWPLPASRPALLSPAVPGRTESTRASMAASAMNASTANCSPISSKPSASHGPSGMNTTTSVLTARSTTVRPANIAANS